MAEKTSNIRQNQQNDSRQRQGAKKTDTAHTGQGSTALNLQQAMNDPASATPGAILELQRIGGNRAVSRLIQAKLTVGAADDAYEREADQMASAALSMPGPVHQPQAAEGSNPVQREGPEEEELLQGKPLAAGISRFVQREAVEEEELQMKSVLQRQEDEEELQMKPILQRQEEEEELQMKPVLQRQEDEEELQMKPILQRQEEEEELQMKPVLQRQEDEDELQMKPALRRVEEEEETLQAARAEDGQKVDPRASFEAGADIERQIQAQSGGGSPLPADVQADMGSRFGADFGQVRVHTDGQAAQLNRELSAQAFTHGSDIYMGEGRFDPGSSAGKHLLAHELTHTIQQSGAVANLGKSIDGEEELQKSPDPTATVLTKSVDGEEELAKGAPTGKGELVHGKGCGCALCQASVQRTAEGETNMQRDLDVSVAEHSSEMTTQDPDMAISDLLAKPSVSVRAGATPSVALGGDYGLTYPENIQATISAKKVGTAWFPVVKSLKGNYSMQAGLLSGQSEITGPGGNTAEDNYLAQIKNLKMLGEDLGNPWYMKKAVVDHEKQHAKHFKPALNNVAKTIATNLEAVSVADSGQKSKDAAKGLQADGAFQTALTAATATWLAEILTLAAGDHATDGPTETAERKIVEPMRKKICSYAKKKKWPASPYC